MTFPRELLLKNSSLPIMFWRADLYSYAVLSRMCLTWCQEGAGVFFHVTCLFFGFHRLQNWFAVKESEDAGISSCIHFYDIPTAPLDIRSLRN